MGFEPNNDDCSKTPPLKTGGNLRTDLVCPVCFHQIENPVIMADGADEVGRRLRTYFGYCHKCGAGHVTIQFKRGDRWVIHKFRRASELPRPAACVAKPETGEAGPTGGDGIETLKSLASMRKAVKAMMGCCQTIECLIKSLVEKQGQSINDDDSDK
jgi:hypothetical protein